MAPRLGSVRRDGWRWWVLVRCRGCGGSFWAYLRLYCLCPRCRSLRLAARARLRAAAHAAPLPAGPGTRRGPAAPAPPKFARQPSPVPRVVNTRVAACQVYVGRGSKWGNPFRIGRHGTRAQVIAQYRAWLVRQPALMAALGELRGKVLGCYCAPQACHGDVLLQLANAPVVASAGVSGPLLRGGLQKGA